MQTNVASAHREESSTNTGLLGSRFAAEVFAAVKFSVAQMNHVSYSAHLCLVKFAILREL